MADDPNNAGIKVEEGPSTASILQNNAEKSAYYKRMVRIFDSFTSDADRRKYVAAAALCFDLKYDSPMHVYDVAATCGIAKRNVDKYELLLNKKQAKKFLVDDCEVVGATARQIRAIRERDYTGRFSTCGKPREPFKRGRSAYWLTVAEWYVILELDTPPALPMRLVEFGRNHGIDL